MKRIAALLFAAVPFFGGAPAQAQSYPAMPVRVVVPFAAGGGTDAVARAIAPSLSDLLGQSVVIDNRAGANGAIGAAEVKRAPADGYSVLLGAAGTMVVAPHLRSDLPFDTQKDFVPIALAASSPFVVAVHPGVPVNSIRELIALAKKNPGRLNYGSSGAGGAPHLAGELFEHMAGIHAVHVPYRGLAPAVTDLIGGQVQILFVDVGVAMPHVKAGRLKALAITSEERSPVAPDLPTVAEAGLPGYSAGTWYGFFAPRNTPEPVVRRLSGDIVKALESADVKSKLTALGAEATVLAGERFGAYVARESDKWGKVIRSAGIKLE